MWYPNDGRVQQLPLAVTAHHQQPALVGADAVAAEQHALLSVEEDVVGLWSGQRTRTAEGGLGGEDEGWRVHQVVGGLCVCEGGERGYIINGANFSSVQISAP